MSVKPKIYSHQLLNGRQLRDQILDWLKVQCLKIKAKPGLATLLIGNDQASQVYIDEKKKAAKRIGFYFENHHLPSSVSQAKVIRLIKKLNQRQDVSGIIVQFPLPRHLDADKLIQTIDPQKDADGFHPENIKKFLILNLDKLKLNFWQKDFGFSLPVTPMAIIELTLQSLTMFEQPQSLNNLKIKIISKCSIFLTPLIHFFKQAQADFEHILSDDPNLSLKTKKADLLIVAVGQPQFIAGDMVKIGVVIIDVGINKVRSHKFQVVGDVDFESVYPKCSLITPVPGGVGPMSVGFLMRNVWFNYHRFLTPA